MHMVARRRSKSFSRYKSAGMDRAGLRMTDGWFWFRMTLDWSKLIGKAEQTFASLFFQGGIKRELGSSGGDKDQRELYKFSSSLSLRSWACSLLNEKLSFSSYRRAKLKERRYSSGSSSRLVISLSMKGLICFARFAARKPHYGWIVSPLYSPPSLPFQYCLTTKEIYTKRRRRRRDDDDGRWILFSFLRHQ